MCQLFVTDKKRKKEKDEKNFKREKSKYKSGVMLKIVITITVPSF